MGLGRMVDRDSWLTMVDDGLQGLTLTERSCTIYGDAGDIAMWRYGDVDMHFHLRV